MNATQPFYSKKCRMKPVLPPVSWVPPVRAIACEMEQMAVNQVTECLPVKLRFRYTQPASQLQSAPIYGGRNLLRWSSPLPMYYSNSIALYSSEHFSRTP